MPLTIVMIVRYPEPRMLHSVGVPHVYFSPYDEPESLAIVSRTPPSAAAILTRDNHSSQISDKDRDWLWSQFLPIVWQSLAKSVARDLASFRALANALWLPFIQPIMDGKIGCRDFSRLVVLQTKLLQNEAILGENILCDIQAEQQMTELDSKVVANTKNDGLTYHSQWLICAAYLASFSPARQDATLFMKSTERKRRRKGGGSAVGRQAANRKIPSHLLSPSPFSLDRLLAIFHTLLPRAIASTIDLHTQIANLTSLRLITKGGVASGDMLDPAARWRANYGLDYAMEVAKSLAFDMTEYLDR